MFCKWCNKTFRTRYEFYQHEKDAECLQFKRFSVFCMACNVSLYGVSEYLSHRCDPEKAASYDDKKSSKKQSTGFDLTEYRHALETAKSMYKYESSKELIESCEDPKVKSCLFSLWINDIYKSGSDLDDSGVEAMLQTVLKTTPVQIVIYAMECREVGEVFSNRSLVEFIKVFNGIYDPRCQNSKTYIDNHALTMYAKTILEEGRSSFNKIYTIIPLSVYCKLVLSKKYEIMIGTERSVYLYKTLTGKKYDPAMFIEMLEKDRIEYYNAIVGIFKKFYTTCFSSNFEIDNWQSETGEWEMFMRELHQNLCISSSSILWYFSAISHLKTIKHDSTIVENYTKICPPVPFQTEEKIHDYITLFTEAYNEKTYDSIKTVDYKLAVFSDAMPSTSEYHSIVKSFVGSRFPLAHHPEYEKVYSTLLEHK